MESFGDDFVELLFERTLVEVVENTKEDYFFWFIDRDLVCAHVFFYLRQIMMTLLSSTIDLEAVERPC